jgi:hypothetical protein
MEVDEGVKEEKRVMENEDKREGGEIMNEKEELELKREADRLTRAIDEEESAQDKRGSELNTDEDTTRSQEQRIGDDAKGSVNEGANIGGESRKQDGPTGSPSSAFSAANGDLSNQVSLPTSGDETRVNVKTDKTGHGSTRTYSPWQPPIPNNSRRHTPFGRDAAQLDQQSITRYGISRAASRAGYAVPSSSSNAEGEGSSSGFFVGRSGAAAA